MPKQCWLAGLCEQKKREKKMFAWLNLCQETRPLAFKIKDYMAVEQWDPFHINTECCCTAFRDAAASLHGRPAMTTSILLNLPLCL